MQSTIIENWFAFHPADTADKQSDHARFREAMLRIAHEVNELVPDESPQEKRIMYRKLREAMHWGNSAIAMQHEVGG